MGVWKLLEDKLSSGPSRSSRSFINYHYIKVKYDSYDSPFPVPFTLPTPALARLEGSHAAVTED